MITKYIRHIAARFLCCNLVAALAPRFLCCNLVAALAACILCCNLVAALTSCSDYLEIYPENVQPTDEYWGTKQEVDATLIAGYYYLREAVETHLIPWGELRAGCVSSRGSNTLQRFEIKPTEKTLSKWTPMYKIINSANLVLKNAGKALDSDDTYPQEELNSHHCEAYWLRALAYFYIVRNWRDAPLITEPFETDELTFNVAKSSEAEIIAQIKSDLRTAIQMDAAKEKFNTTWETKGRATKWAILALMTDVCLWNQDFDEAITYADAIVESTSPSAPRFLSTPTHSSWFSMFNPGNSGGALVNVNGELVGIITAIASPTGSFSGYSFAVPERIARKTVSDLMEFGTVQRAYIGISISEVTSESAQRNGISSLKGGHTSGIALILKLFSSDELPVSVLSAKHEVVVSVDTDVLAVVGIADSVDILADLLDNPAP